ncbi:heat shock 70 kDa protein 12B-like [Mercenaria mercenaria]|uniref:heat shock 70 kDa protein 12B-like n=1 Tax=Mercenaria mercenaria TaxID=6596 RepID=UPI00234EC598|nr:heat shock 70 kDa protein 12B-like [Mercenaria mercenaria]
MEGSMLPSDTKLVIAIDIGTTQSGYAFSFTCKPDEINTCSFAGRPPNTKTPTSILLNKAGKFVSYGQEAEDKFSQLCEADDMSYRLFRNFKMALHLNHTLSKATKVQDISGQHSASVYDLLVMSLLYLKNHVMRTVNRFSDTYSEDDAFFVLLVPAIFDDRAKWLMREVALKAGLRSEKFTMAFESETSSLWCLHENISGIKNKGTRYITVDLGGGTADIVAHESQGDGTVEALHSPCGGDWGAINVDNCFKSYLSLLFGTRSIDDFVKQDLREWYKLVRNYEASKLAENSKTTELRVHIPLTLLSSAVENKGLHGAYELAELIKSPNFGGHFKMVGESLEIDEEATKGMYTYVVNSVVAKLEQLMQMGVVSDKSFDHVIIVGGLVNCGIVKEMFQSSLKRYTLVFPQSSEMFAVKGAVLYGYNKSLIRSRVIPLTYGIKSTVPYDDNKHCGAKFTTINGLKMCTENFHVLVKAGTKLKPGHEVKELDKPLRPEDKEQRFEIYSCGSADDIPAFTSHCTIHKEASFSVPLPYGCLVDDKVFERCSIFGETEISFRLGFKKGKRDVFIKNMEYN